MSAVEHVTPLEIRKIPSWQRYLLDTLLAVLGILLITEIIALFHLYPRIPNISIVYLLVILGLASTRGSYPALLAAVLAFFSFDFFIVPPLYTFVMYHVEEWIALFVFLIDALLTSQLAVGLRKRAEQSARRERETHILYDLMRVATSDEEPERQLQSIARAIVEIFSSWGVDDCAVLQPDSKGTLQVQTSAYQPAEKLILSSDERIVAAWVMTNGRSMRLFDDDALVQPTLPYRLKRVLMHSVATGQGVARHSLRLIPLKMGQQVVGVLRLRLLDDGRLAKQEEYLEEEHDAPNARTTFFWTFLDQAASLIERARLRQDNMRIVLLQRTDALRAALLSSVSHDLRTPLTTIKAAASSLLQQDVQWDDEAKLSFASSIEREADRLNHLVGNLLDMSRIEDGALKPEKELYVFHSLLHDVLHRLQPLLQGRDLRTDLAQDVPPIELDYLQIDQVLTNLIENALRYTPPASPIEISTRYDGSYVIVSVADRGPGIPTADLERIFDKFYRVLDTTARKGGYPTGSGLGLAVCKGVIEAHGGRIWAEPRVGGGVVFRFTLPASGKEGC